MKMMMMMKENKKTTSGFVSDFSDKVAAPTTTTAETTTTSCSSGDGLCLKLQRTESFPYKSSTSSSSSSSSRMMMMNQHPSNQGVFGGPTFVNGINEGSCYETAFNGGGGGVVLGGGGGGGVASTRTLLQPFYSAFKSPAGGVGGIGGMATAYLRFPFTTAQWQELEQQALIYKYMMASVPIPPDLLIPISRNLSEATTTTTTTAPTLIGVGRGGGHRSSSSSCFNLRFSSNTDPEPGRCRRTDGKKWRCSRDVAPDQKYCERHMHRGRPRSRKHVEAVVQQQQQQQQTQMNNNNNSSTNINKMIMFNNHLSSVPTPTTSTTTTTSNKSSSYSGFSSKSDFKVPPFESMASPRTFKDHNRSMEWMMRGGETVPVSATDQVQWGNQNQNQFMNSKPEMRNPSSSSSLVFQQQYHQTPNLNSYTHFGTNEAQNQCCLYLNPEFSSLDESLSSDHHRETPRRFIDAWSNARDSSTSNKRRESNKSSSSSSLSSGFGNQKFSPSSLTLSMSGCNSTTTTTTTTGEEIDEIQMGLGVIDSGSIKSQPLSWMTPAASWMTSLPGGPLGEVLQSSTAAIHGCSNINSRSSCLNLMSEGWGGSSINGHETSSSPRLTSISSPSGVLQKTFASLSDSSGNSSPNSLPVVAAAKSEIALQLLNQSRLPSSS